MKNVLNKVVALTLMGIIAAGLAACGDKTDTATNTPAVEKAAPAAPAATEQAPPAADQAAPAADQAAPAAPAAEQK